MNTLPKKEWAKYQRQRRTKSITMLVPDQEFKNRVKAAAAAEERTVNNWLQRYILPLLERELDIAAMNQIRNAPHPAATNLTEKMVNDAKRSLRK